CHKDRPEVVYILSGKIIDHQGNIAKEYGPGESFTAGKDTTHWMENKGTVPAVLIVSTIARKECHTARGAFLAAGAGLADEVSVRRATRGKLRTLQPVGFRSTSAPTRWRAISRSLTNAPRWRGSSCCRSSESPSFELRRLKFDRPRLRAGEHER